jgi:hypothetical protein
MISADAPLIQKGMIYEDCAFHPVLCVGVHSDESVSGISLIDGSYPRNCSLTSCGVIPLSVEEAVEIRKDFSSYVAERKRELAGRQ